MTKIFRITHGSVENDTAYMIEKGTERGYHNFSIGDNVVKSGRPCSYLGYAHYHLACSSEKFDQAVFCDDLECIN